MKRFPGVNRIISAAFSTFLALSAFGQAHAAAAVRAGAARGDVHGNGRNCYGSGWRNYNVFSIGSPTRIGGVQNASNSSVRTADNVMNAYCKKKRYCRVIQKQVRGFP